MSVVVLNMDLTQEQRNELAEKWLKKALYYITQLKFGRARFCVNGGLLCNPDGSIRERLLNQQADLS